MRDDGIKPLSHSEKIRLKKCPVDAQFEKTKIESLADYIAVLSPTLSSSDGQTSFWFRGHQDIKWSLVPSALRYKDPKERKKALNMIWDFQRIAEIKIERPPKHENQLEWMQIAQHYGIPTRLLDWTESAVFALYFACSNTREDTDGIVFHLNPAQLLTDYPKKSGKRSSLEEKTSEEEIASYMELGETEISPKGKSLPTIAISPVWNSQRLLLQRGAFTLHGSRKFALDKKQAPSLVGVPIFKDAKQRLLEELENIGVDELTLFPELEHTCSHLKKKRGLK